MYSNPPVHGARIVAHVLSHPTLKAQWYAECKGMADRIQAMRLALRERLEKAEFLEEHHRRHHQRRRPAVAGRRGRAGMFCYTGLSLPQVLRLREEFHVFCTDDGRFSMAGINSGNIDYLAESMLAVV